MLYHEYDDIINKIAVLCDRHRGACLQGGIYVVELIDKFTLAFPLLIIVMLELVVISYFYGRAAHRIDMFSFNTRGS